MIFVYGDPTKYREIKEGDKVTRMLAGKIPMKLKVTKVDDRLIHCGAWTFSRITGGEIDEDLGWAEDTHTGSYLIEPGKEPQDE